jgi:hypothetical protein
MSQRLERLGATLKPLPSHTLAQSLLFRSPEIRQVVAECGGRIKVGIVVTEKLHAVTHSLVIAVIPETVVYETKTFSPLTEIPALARLTALLQEGKPLQEGDAKVREDLEQIRSLQGQLHSLHGDKPLTAATIGKTLRASQIEPRVINS